VSIHSEIGLVNGCFDLFHRGHARFLWEARKRCGYLVAALNDDESIRQLKGPSRPFDNLHYRMDRVSAYADQVLPFNGDVEALLEKIRPHVVFRGWDQNCADVFDIPVIQLPQWGSISTSQLEAYCERQARQGDPRLDGGRRRAALSRGAGPHPAASSQGKTR
jgi:cytidyltransferase-like protein